MKLIVSSIAFLSLASFCATALGEDDGGEEAPLDFATRGLLVRAAIGIALCAGPDADDPNSETIFQCDSFGGQRLGPALTGALGWRFQALVAAEVGFTFAWLGIERREDKGIMTSKLGRWFGPRIGARIYPLQARYRVEPVLGAHLGYVRLEAETDVDYSCDPLCPDILRATRRAWLHGVQLDLGIGLELHITESIALDLTWSAFENFWVERCTHSGACEEFDGEFDDWFFNFDLGISAIFG